MRAIGPWAVVLSLVGLAGCGGGSTTRTLTSNFPVTIPAGYCGAVAGPYTVPAGSMSFTIIDTPTGIGDDSMEAGIMFESDFAAGGCNFDLAIVDDVGTGSVSDHGPIVAGTYDFVVGCNNIVDPCIFELTWTATH